MSKLVTWILFLNNRIKINVSIGRRYKQPFEFSIADLRTTLNYCKC